MSLNETILHIVYIHGFQGDHTTFQSFPTDLHHALQPQLPSHITLRSVLYPTYESKRPIAVAAENFLNWLDTIPAGPVILSGHSMGGLLAADAATHRTHPAAKRVVALLAYDAPYLGMHPHVVISGIASLLPSKKGAGGHGSEGLKSEKEVNDARHVDVRPGRQSPSPNTSSAALAPQASNTPASSNAALAPPLPPRRSSNNLSPSPPSSPSPSVLSRSHSPPAVLSRTLDFLHAHADDPLVHFLAQHRAAPLAAAKQWVVESFEFGSCMFDPRGLRDRYAALERWGGRWVVFWTETVGRGGEVGGEVKQEEGVKAEQEATAALGKLLEPESSTTSTSGSQSPSQSSVSFDSPSPTTAVTKQDKADQKKLDKELKARAKAAEKQQAKSLKALRKEGPHPHHFVVRPFCTPATPTPVQQPHTAPWEQPHPESAPTPSPTHRWERVAIRGAKDEVEAHCGLFLRDINLEYGPFVERVARVVRGWVEELGVGAEVNAAAS